MLYTFQTVRGLFLVGAVALAFGCGAPREDASSATAAGTSTEAPTPTFLASSDLGLIKDRRLLQVGADGQYAQTFFDRPERAFELRDLPPGFEAKYRSRGWQIASEGFGILLYEDKVALAMRYFEHRDDAFFDALLQEYQRRFPALEPLQSTARAARYWFAESGDDRLMLCAARTPSGELTITIAVGHKAVMDRLRMSKEAARVDAEQAERSLAQLAKSGT